MDLKHLLKQYQHRIENQLSIVMQRESIAPRIQQAMLYSLLNGGKRIRPTLLYMTNQLLDGQISHADRAACALEAIHSYSLIHDDLPAMDDDNLRRGQPTCHIKFDEATAVLAGDALQTLAFELIASDSSSLNDQFKLKMLHKLSLAAGDQGMIAGQMFDVQHEGQALTLKQLEQMHNHKTGALISIAIELGALSAGCSDETALQNLRKYGQAIGLAFQVKDDILDIESDTLTLGKPQGSDLHANKPTYPALLGLEGAKEKLDQLHHAALQALEQFGETADPLRNLASYIVNRDY